MFGGKAFHWKSFTEEETLIHTHSAHLGFWTLNRLRTEPSLRSSSPRCTPSEQPRGTAHLNEPGPCQRMSLSRKAHPSPVSSMASQRIRFRRK
ncbi:uncharacterized protein [Salmo salar]|uniref:Uncharacterized protein n=1 Tax=Salmo salar TaxID=8030 RepID=A0ABM3CLB8_SALSA|nr:uncharacterized protein LOC106565289 [Salmo salar]|eukprot:XP_013987711.1 PREDICTED: uncharacterized protein LOC106565289 isoform X2 [Salmo salar]